MLSTSNKLLFACRRFFLRKRFRQEITWIVIIKLVLLTLLWQLFFTHPPKDQLQHDALINHFISAKTTAVP